MKGYYTIKELEQEVHYGSRTTIWRHIKAGILPHVKMPTGRVLIPIDAFNRRMLEYELEKK